MDEDKDKKEPETPKEEPKPEDTGKGDKSETASAFDEADERIKRMAEENSRREAILKREEDLYKRKMLSGQTEAGSVPEPPKKLTDTEYAEALQRGEVNPLKEDGFIK